MESSLNPAPIGRDLIDVTADTRARAATWTRLYTFPWWGVLLIVGAIWVVYSISANEDYTTAFDRVKDGLIVTLRVSVGAYALALILGLMIGVARSNVPQPSSLRLPIRAASSSLAVYYAVSVWRILGGFGRIALYNLATLYVEIVRGLPIPIVLPIFVYIIIPQFRDFMLATFDYELPFRSGSEETATVALAMAYAAFLSEVFRAGIQSIGRGQIEAARSLGLTPFQSMRHIILPQAVRRILPPLGNDFISMIKDSSLVSILAVQDVTQLAKRYTGSSFKYVETYATVAVIYLSLTLVGSLLVRVLEHRLRDSSHG
jgi:polar amino acid transport system permease protein